MTDPNRRSSARASLFSALVATTLLAAACGGDGLAPTSPAASSRSSAPSPASVASLPSTGLTPVPGGSTPSPVAPSGTPTQTDTAWGRIWDALPPSFPRIAASAPADSITGPVSAAFVVDAAPTAATATLKGLLDGAGYTTDQSGPLEDGSFVLDSTGTSAGCKVQTTLAPQAKSTLMTVLFGAACPFE
jgi:hypothetical protein